MAEWLRSLRLLLWGTFKTFWPYIVFALLSVLGLYDRYAHLLDETPKAYLDQFLELLWPWKLLALALFHSVWRAFHKLRMENVNLRGQVGNELHHRLAVLERQAARRTLTDEQQALISKCLSAHHESREITIAYASQAPDARTYADDFVKAFNQAEWRIDGPVADPREDKVGVWILGRDPMGKQPRSEGIIETALNEADVPVRASPESSVADLVLLVGRGH